MGLPLTVGDLAPWFSAPTPGNPAYHFSTLSGRYVLLGFIPDDAQAQQRAANAFLAHRSRFDDVNLTAFLVVADPKIIATARNQPPGLRWFFDPDRAVAGLYGVDGQGCWMLMDPALRIVAMAPIDAAAPVFDLIANLAPVAQDAVAPVLIAPRILEPELCRRLIACYEADGGAASGVMRDVDGRTVGVLDDFKRRRDASITDPDLRAALRERIERRLVPAIRRAFQFEATRVERYIVACYDATDGGYFRPHRDNETFATAHRRFAVTINLNTEEFAGGELRFPEFGRRTYRAPTGGAVVFACGLQHEATQVTSGRRYAFVPFLYDEAGAQMRAANHAREDALASEKETGS